MKMVYIHLYYATFFSEELIIIAYLIYLFAIKPGVEHQMPIHVLLQPKLSVNQRHLEGFNKSSFFISEACTLQCLFFFLITKYLKITLPHLDVARIKLR